MNAPNPAVKADWISYVINGISNCSTVRKEILESWKRSRSYGIDPYLQYEIIAPDLDERIKNNAELIHYADPVLQYISATNSFYFRENVVAITDSDAVHIHTVASPEMRRFCHGLDGSERACGTNGVNLVLHEDKPFEIGGYEKYRRSMHSLTGGCVPIHGADGKIAGVITFFNQFDKTPEQPLEFECVAARLIENAMHSGSEQAYVHQPLFQEFIDYVPQSVIVIDGKQKICRLNKNAKKLLTELRAHSMDKLADIGIDLQLAGATPPTSFNLGTAERSTKCSLQNNRSITDLNGETYTLLLIAEQKESAAARLERGSAEKENWRTLPGFDRIIGNSRQIRNALGIAYRASQVEANVLIEGETGTGKELFAQAISLNSKRSKDFVAVNCGAIQKELLQSELFGYEGGSFTGANKSGKKGSFEAANGGTIFLDEIGEMPLDMQVSLLRVLQEKSVTRIGGIKPIPVNVRVIAATNKNVRSAAVAGTFREDLYYRLNVINIVVPPLRDREEDIPLLVDYFLQQYKGIYNFQNLYVQPEAVEQLCRYPWPGNVRELANVVHNLVIFAVDDAIGVEQLPDYIRGYAISLKSAEPEVGSIKDAERETILKVLESCGGNITKAAGILGIGRNTLYRKLKKFGIQNI